MSFGIFGSNTNPDDSIVTDLDDYALPVDFIDEFDLAKIKALDR